MSACPGPQLSVTQDSKQPRSPPTGASHLCRPCPSSSARLSAATAQIGSSWHPRASASSWLQTHLHICTLYRIFQARVNKSREGQKSPLAWLPLAGLRGSQRRPGHVPVSSSFCETPRFRGSFCSGAQNRHLLLRSCARPASGLCFALTVSC